MPLPVQLGEVVYEMEFGDDGWTGFINRKTGELTSFPGDLLANEGEVDTSARGWEEEMAEDCRRVLASADFIELPSKFDIHEYAIVERFCLSHDDEVARERLLDAIKGRGAFRRFKDLVHSMGIHQDWYRYREDALKRVAVDFLEVDGIPYVDDPVEPQ